MRRHLESLATVDALSGFACKTGLCGKVFLVVAAIRTAEKQNYRIGHLEFPSLEDSFCAGLPFGDAFS